MVSPQATQPVQSPHPRQGDSVRITAQVPRETRRQVLREHLADELVRAQAIAASEANDLKVLRGNGQPCAQAELRAANATAVLQYIGSTLAAYSDNRDFRGVAK